MAWRISVSASGSLGWPPALFRRVSRVVIRSFSWGVINASRRASAPVTRRATGTPLGAAVDGSTLTHQPHAHMIVPGGGYRAPSIPRRLTPDRTAGLGHGCARSRVAASAFLLPWTLSVQPI